MSTERGMCYDCAYFFNTSGDDTLCSLYMQDGGEKTGKKTCDGKDSEREKTCPLSVVCAVIVLNYPARACAARGKAIVLSVCRHRCCC